MLLVSLLTLNGAKLVMVLFEFLPKWCGGGGNNGHAYLE